MAFKRNIRQLVNNDFDQNGNLAIKGPCVVIVQGSFCGHCVKMKPQFQLAADNSPRGLQWATVQLDGRHPQQQQLAKRLDNILSKQRVDFSGVPLVVMFNGGRVAKVYKGDRSARSLLEFAGRR